MDQLSRRQPGPLNLDDFRIRPFIPDYQVSYDYPINSLSELCNLCVSEESWFWGGADEGGFGCGIRRRERLSRIDIYRVR